MINLRQFTNPEGRQGYHCVGKATSAGTGILTITIAGMDFSSRITGLSLIPVYDQAAKLCVVQLTSIAYANGVTTILARVFTSDDIATPAFSLTDSITVYYSFWIDTEPEGLPTDETTNDTTAQIY